MMMKHLSIKLKKMKKTFVVVPAVLVLFMVNSFVLKEKETGKKTAEGTSSLTDLTLREKNKNKAAPASIIFKSTDDGQTWQDISEGLPENLQREGVWRDGVVADDRGLYLRAGNSVYHSDPNSTTPFWTKEAFPGNQRNITLGENGIFAYDFRGQFLQKLNGANDWSPMYTNFQEQAVRLNKTVDWMYKNYKEKQVCSFFETTGGTVFVGSNNALFKSADGGKTWKDLNVGGWVTKMVESNGVLLAASTLGILKSTDDGENWDYVVNEGGAGITVERIDGGFAAIAHNAITQTDRIHISLDEGKTWNIIGEELQPSLFSLLFKQVGGPQPLSVSSIKQVGKYLVCGRSDGLYRSSDMGKTWTLLPLPAVKNYGFSLSVAGNVIYAMTNRGC